LVSVDFDDKFLGSVKTPAGSFCCLT